MREGGAGVIIDATQAVRIVYKNYRGEVAVRRIRPLAIWFGATEWHPEPQWLLSATDLDKGENRDFAIKDISKWVPA